MDRMYWNVGGCFQIQHMVRHRLQNRYIIGIETQVCLWFFTKICPAQDCYLKCHVFSLIKHCMCQVFLMEDNSRVGNWKENCQGNQTTQSAIMAEEVISPSAFGGLYGLLYIVRIISYLYEAQPTSKVRLKLLLLLLHRLEITTCSQWDKVWAAGQQLRLLGLSSQTLYWLHLCNNANTS